MERDYPDLGYGGGGRNLEGDIDERPNYDEMDFVDNTYQNANGRKQTKKKSMRIQNNRGETVMSVDSSQHGFESFPAIVHFSGWTTGREFVQVVNIKNASKKSIRFQIYPPASAEFSIQYEKLGSLAPGMAQKVIVTFVASEYKYHYDCFSFLGENDASLIVPLHAYPITNKVYFPKLLDFGKIPLCEPAVRKLSLSCSIPVNFSFEVKVLQGHPYFQIEPRLGIIPANGSIDVKIVFSPMTLGRCTTKLRVLVGQYGFTPLDCEVSAMAVSGLIESREMAKADRRVLDFIINTGNKLNEVLGNTSSFRGTLTAKPGVGNMLGMTDNRMGSMSMSRSVNAVPDLGAPMMMGQLDRFAETRFLQSGGARHHKRDPVAMMLASTFQAADLDNTLDDVVQDKQLLGTKVLQRSKDGRWQEGVRAVHGQLLSTQPVCPRGPGSGLMFDSGAQWASLQHAQYTTRKQLLTKSKTKGNHREEGGNNAGDEDEEEGGARQEKVVAGLRIPATLDSVTSVSFVLTQEAGKLKPKDLKVAIDRNRAERADRAAEQERMREEGGGAGSLDRMGVLAEEKLNMAGDGDPFKRQLRELAFLADVDEVDKQEAEKEFRVSEEYLGSNLLSQEDVEVILWQRKLMSLRRKRADWRVTQSRQHNKLFPPTHANVKAGAPSAVVRQAMRLLTPSFDTNRNDIWAKRMNTLRYFVSMVTRWIIRRRVQQRLQVVKARINEVCYDVLHGPLAAFLTEKPKVLLGGGTSAAAAELILAKKKRALHKAMKDCVRAWINDENSANKMKGGSLAANSIVGDDTMSGGELAGGKATQAMGANRSPDEEEEGGEQSFTFEQCATVAELVCASDDAYIVRRHRSEMVLTGARIEMTSYDTVQRLLFPKCIVEEGNTLLPLPAPAIEAVAPRFDDRSFFPLKVRPEYVSMRYTTHRVPEVPLFFPTGRDKPTRMGAPEEAMLRPPADYTATSVDLLSNLPPEPPTLSEMRLVASYHAPGGMVSENDLWLAAEKIEDAADAARREGVDDDATALALLTTGNATSGQSLPLTAERLLAPPSWLAPSDDDLFPSSSTLHGGGGRADADRGPGLVWSPTDIDFFRPRSDLRVYAAAPAVKETDADWILRPYASSLSHYKPDPEALMYKDDPSVRSRWLSLPGFSSAHAYLLGSLETRCTKAPSSGRPVPPPGPTLTDYYRPDTDRHHSGLYCFRQDHLRSLTDYDPDYGPLQHRQDRGDLLTDSESDDEDKYLAPKPSMRRVRALLNAVSTTAHSSGSTVATTGGGRPGSAVKGGKSVVSPGKDAVVATATTASLAVDVNDDDDPTAFGLGLGTRPTRDQVELMRDRKTLELESALLKTRNDRAAAVANGLSKLSKASKCLLQSLSVQLPLHLYQEEVVQPFSTKLTPIPTTFIQPPS